MRYALRFNVRGCGEGARFGNARASGERRLFLPPNATLEGASPPLPACTSNCEVTHCVGTQRLGVIAAADRWWVLNDRDYELLANLTGAEEALGDVCSDVGVTTRDQSLLWTLLNGLFPRSVWRGRT